MVQIQSNLNRNAVYTATAAALLTLMGICLTPPKASLENKPVLERDNHLGMYKNAPKMPKGAEDGKSEGDSDESDESDGSGDEDCSNQAKELMRQIKEMLMADRGDPDTKHLIEGHAPETTIPDGSDKEPEYETLGELVTKLRDGEIKYNCTRVVEIFDAVQRKHEATTLSAVKLQGDRVLCTTFGDRMYKRLDDSNHNQKAVLEPNSTLCENAKLFNKNELEGDAPIRKVLRHEWVIIPRDGAAAGVSPIKHPEARHLLFVDYDTMQCQNSYYSSKSNSTKTVKSQVQVDGTSYLQELCNDELDCLDEHSGSDQFLPTEHVKKIIKPTAQGFLERQLSGNIMKLSSPNSGPKIDQLLISVLQKYNGQSVQSKLLAKAIATAANSDYSIAFGNILARKLLLSEILYYTQSSYHPKEPRQPCPRDKDLDHLIFKERQNPAYSQQFPILVRQGIQNACLYWENALMCLAAQRFLLANFPSANVTVKKMSKLEINPADITLAVHSNGTYYVVQKEA